MKNITVNTCLLFLMLSHICAFSQQKAHKIVVENTVEWEYLLYLPEGYEVSDSVKIPLMLFLHAGGESGDNIESLKKYGPPKLVAEGKDFPMVILSPQNPNVKGFFNETALINLLDKIQLKYHVDVNRTYLVGISRGAYSAWRLAIQYPDRFAALIAISGEAPSTYAPWLKNMPIWVFHGQDDTDVDISASDRMVEKLKQHGNQVKYTRYENVAHEAWTPTFENNRVFEWLLSQKKN